MTPAERLALLEQLDRVIRERNTWEDLRALDAYESLWEMAYGAAHQAVQVAAAARQVVEQDIAAEQVSGAQGRDLDVLATVGRMYLEALDSDPDNEMLTLPQAMLVTEVREAVERREALWEPAEQPEPARGFTLLDPRATLDRDLLDRLEIVSHNGVDDRDGWAEVVIREKPGGNQ